MNKKTLESNLLIPVIFVVVFLSMTVNIVSAANLPKCSVRPGVGPDPDPIDSEYCPNCPPATVHCSQKPTPGASGCSCADTACAEWIRVWYDDTITEKPCDLLAGVHVCKAVCSDITNMGICSQVMELSSNIESWYYGPWQIFSLDYVPLGGCARFDIDCQVGNKYPHRHASRETLECSKVINGKIYLGTACCSDTGYDCAKNTQCCNLNDKCINGICQATSDTCVSTDQTDKYPAGDDPYMPGTTTKYRSEVPVSVNNDICINRYLQEWYCANNNPTSKTIDCQKECGTTESYCDTDFNGRGYCHCVTPTPTTTPKIRGGGGGGGLVGGQRAVLLSPMSTAISAIVVAIFILALVFIAMKFTKKK